MARWAYLFFTLLSVNAFAIVDMKNANFADSWQDLIATGSGYDLRVRRTYNSRSLFNGIFGFGWCSDFETSLAILDSGEIKLTECGGGLEVLYSPKKSMDKDSRKLALTKPGTVFYANGKGVEGIEFKGDHYLRKMVDGTSQRFDKEGRMIQVSDKNGNYLKISYNSRGPMEIVDNNGRKLGFSYYENGKVKKVIGPNSSAVEYKFKGDDMTEVKNAWGNVYTYQYDDLHNLTQINFPDKTAKKISYNKDKDWVTSFTNRKGCVEKYDYKLDGDGKDHYRSEAVKTCKDQVTNKSFYEFWYKSRADGSKFLSRVLTNNNGDETDMTYHEVFGRPTAVVKNGEKVVYKYTENGQVQEQIFKDRMSKFKYDSDLNKIGEVTTTYFHADKKKEKSVVTNFSYDGKGNVVEAKNSFGQQVKIGYDPKGRIVSIKDQAKKWIKITYEERFGKPSKVESHGVGTINVTYKGSGDIDKVDSKEGPIVAQQVASTFNNLMDILAPATTQLRL